MGPLCGLLIPRVWIPTPLSLTSPKGASEVDGNSSSVTSPESWNLRPLGPALLPSPSCFVSASWSALSSWGYPGDRRSTVGLIWVRLTPGELLRCDMHLTAAMWVRFCEEAGQGLAGPLGLGSLVFTLLLCSHYSPFLKPSVPFLLPSLLAG